MLHRKSSRLDHRNYIGRATYFLTICCDHRRPYLANPAIAAMDIEALLRSVSTVGFQFMPIASCQITFTFSPKAHMQPRTLWNSRAASSNLPVHLVEPGPLGTMSVSRRLPILRLTNLSLDAKINRYTRLVRTLAFAKGVVARP